MDGGLEERGGEDRGRRCRGWLPPDQCQKFLGRGRARHPELGAGSHTLAYGLIGPNNSALYWLCSIEVYTALAFISVSLVGAHDSYCGDKQYIYSQMDNVCDVNLKVD